MRRLVSVLTALMTLTFVQARPSMTEAKDDSQKLMLILLDGFRWDYVDKYNLEHFKRFYSQGVHARSVQSVFPTLSFPNYYSITTGLYPESHGMVGNMMYQPETGQIFNMNYDPVTYVQPDWWEGATPLWVSAEQQGKTAYMYRWLGPEVAIHGRHPTFFIPYTGSPTLTEFRDAGREGLEALRNGSAHFVGIYNEEPDLAGHIYGPDSPVLGITLAGIDNVIGKLLDEMENLSEDEKVNLIIVSDHGMVDIDRSRVINVTSVLTPDLYTTITEDNALINIFLSDPSQEDKVFNLLSGFHPHLHVYRRADIPDRYHYKRGRYVPRIVCTADLGWVIVHPVKPYFYTNRKTGADLKGMHGFDNSQKDMQGIFYGMGQYFKPGASVESLSIVDPYGVMCSILGITPQPNNGTLQHMAPLLASGGRSQLLYRPIIVVLSLLLIANTY